MTDFLIPILNGEGADYDLQWQDDEPLERVVPTHGEAPGGADEPRRVSVEATRDGVHNRKLAESVNDIEDHHSNDQEVDEKRTGTLSTCQLDSPAREECCALRDVDAWE